MDDPSVDLVMESAMSFAESLAYAHVGQKGDLIELFATFVGIVVQEDGALGLYCLQMLDDWRRSET